MAEHHTQGRQGQGARRRRNYHANRNYRHRMPRPEEPKPSFFRRMLSMFGIGKKKQAATTDGKAEKPSKGDTAQSTQRVRVAQTRSKQRNGTGAQAAGKQPRRAPIPPPSAHSTRLYVGNLSFESTEPELEELFKGFGRVRKVEVVYNSRTYRSKGFAFVEMETEADAKRAMEVLNGQPFMGRELRVCAAGEKREHERGNPPEESVGAHEKTQDAGDDVTTENADFGEETVVNLPEANVSTPTETQQD